MSRGSLSKNFNLDDFNEVVYQLFLRNDSSGTSVNKSELLKIVSVDFEEVVFTAPVGTCNIGHYLTLFIFKRNSSDAKINISRVPLSGNLKGSVEVTGKVKSLNNKKEIISIILKCTQFDKEEWESLAKDFLERQQLINELFQSNKKNI